MDVKPLLQGLLQGTSFDKDSFGKPLDARTRPSDRPDPAATGALPPVIPQDVFEKAPDAESKSESQSQSQSAAQTKAADGLRVSMHFDLFYQLSQKVTARMGQSGGKRFTEVASTVAETFKGNFSLTIDPIGSYLKGTEKSLDISPETANSFFNAVAGLADQSPQALEGFLKESDKLFNELEGKFGEAGGTFDELKKQVQDQATTFFRQVAATRGQAAGQPVTGQTADQATLEDAQQLLPPGSTAGKDASATPVVAGKNGMINSQGYQDFLKNFIDYVQKFQKQSLLDFFSSNPTTLNQPVKLA